jgi:hypothetical protein
MKMAECCICQRDFSLGDEGEFDVERVGHRHKSLLECVAALGRALREKEDYDLEQRERR